MATVTTVPQSQPLWFIDTLAHVLVDGEDTVGRYSVVESVAPARNMPPLHVHEREDEVFHLVDGELTVFLPGQQIELRAGDTLRAPQGIPHTYRVGSETARWIVFCEPAGLETFVRAVSEEAPFDDLPPAGRDHDLPAIEAAAAAQGIVLLGPPGALPEA
jgi:quercetin dioxygenase-like cupin family protein